MNRGLNRPVTAHNPAGLRSVSQNLQSLNTSSPDVTLTGARAGASAAGRGGTPFVALPGARAQAQAAGRGQSPRISLLGTRAAAQAAGRGGAFAISTQVVGTRAVAQAAGRGGTPQILATGARAQAQAAGRAAAPLIAITGTRAAAQAAGRGGTVQAAADVTISGARAQAQAAGRGGTVQTLLSGERAAASAVQRRIGYSTTIEESVTLTTGLNLQDGALYIPGKGIFAITTGTPAKIVKFANPDDLATYTSQTFAADGKHGGSNANNIVYDSNTDLCHVVHSAYVGFGGGDNYGIVISQFDPDDITTIGTTADFDTGTLFSQGSPALVLTGGFLYVLTGPTLENARLFKIDPSDGSVDASMQFTGTDRTRGHGFTTDGTRLYVDGNKLSAPRSCWAGWAELDLSAFDSIALGIGFNASDDVTTIGSYVYYNIEQETTPSGTVKKVAKDLSTVTDIQIGYPTGVDAQYYDGTYLWVTSNGDLIASGSQASALIRIDPANNAVVDYGQFSGGQTKTNELLLVDTETFVITTFEQPSTVFRVALVSPSVIHITVSGERAGALAAGRGGTVQAGADVTISGERAAAQAAGRGGVVQSGNDVTVQGERAVAQAAGRAGAPSSVLPGARGQAQAAARAQAPQVSPSFARAAASGGGRGGADFRIAVDGSRAVAQAVGRGGNVQIGGTVVVTGERAAAQAAGRAGAPTILLTGARAQAQSAGRGQSPKLSPSFSRAVAQATGRGGTFTINSSVAGVRAAAQCAGRAGAPRIAFTGARAAASAACRGGTNRAICTGVRAAAAANGRGGLVIVHARFDGARAAAVADCRGGGVILAAGVPRLTPRTRTSAGRGVTILATNNGRTKVHATASRTKTET